MSNGEEREVGVRSVERAISILDLLAQGGWRTGADVARELHVHRSTALRLLGTLERHALVERDQRTARYRLGRRLPQLASVVTGEFDLRYVARPVCEQLAAAAGETATLDVLVGDVIVPIEQATASTSRSEEHTSELQSPCNLVCRLLLETKHNRARPDSLFRHTHLKGAYPPGDL